VQLESALKSADDIIVDGRNRVRGLRVDESAGDLLANLQKVADAAGFDPPIPIRVVVEGKTRPVHPLVATEIKRIAGEALFNIARHAHARSVDVTITYGNRQLGVQIRDDGVGIEASVLARGLKENHFGLIGMRERAERIGGTLSIDSSAGKGTDVMLTLPSRLAYSQQRPGWLSRLPWRHVHESVGAHG
jgi:signal transduction histidine kinase